MSIIQVEEEKELQAVELQAVEAIEQRIESLLKLIQENAISSEQMTIELCNLKKLVSATSNLIETQLKSQDIKAQVFESAMNDLFGI